MVVVVVVVENDEALEGETVQAVERATGRIGGDGDVPHPAVGRARRMQVATPSMQSYAARLGSAADARHTSIEAKASGWTSLGCHCSAGKRAAKKAACCSVNSA